MPRFRSTTLIDEYQGPYTITLTDPYGANLGVLSYTYHHVKSKSITDVLTTGYYGKLRNSEFLPINTVDIGTNEEVLVQPHAGSATFTGGGGAGTVTGHAGSYVTNYHGSFMAIPTPSSSDIDHVVIKALAAAKAPDLDVLTFLAEFRQTASLLSNASKRIFRLAEGVAKRVARREARRARRQRRPYDSKQALEDFFSAWLEVRYGWRPLLYDVQGFLKVLGHKNRSGIARRSSKHTVEIDDSTTFSGSIPGAVTWTGTKEQVGQHRFRAVVYHLSDMSPIGANPVITAWEVLPYSFVVDWFIDVGKWLQAISPRVGYNQLGVSVGWVTEYTEIITTVLGSSGSWVNGYGPQVVKRQVKSYHREAYTGIPIPSVQVNLNKFKIVDLIALVFQHQRKMAGILRL